MGIHFAKVIDDLGLRSELAGKIVLAANGIDVARKVASGEAELGITQVSEIRHVDATPARRPAARCAATGDDLHGVGSGSREQAPPAHSSTR